MLAGLCKKAGEATSEALTWAVREFSLGFRPFGFCLTDPDHPYRWSIRGFFLRLPGYGAPTYGPRPGLADRDPMKLETTLK